MKSPLELIKDAAEGVWRTMKPDELEEATEQLTNPNRAMRRAHFFGVSMKRRGAGYTKSMHGGRTPREVEAPRRQRFHVLTPDERFALGQERDRLIERRNAREERRS